MSLDVYLVETESTCSCCGRGGDEQILFSANITHNLGEMAEAVGIYEFCWIPEEIGVEKAGQLIEPLTNGLELLKSDPDRFKAFNSPNGWGLYENFVPWVEEYLRACVCNPDALVKANR